MTMQKTNNKKMEKVKKMAPPEKQYYGQSHGAWPQCHCGTEHSGKLGCTYQEKKQGIKA